MLKAILHVDFLASCPQRTGWIRELASLQGLPNRKSRFVFGRINVWILGRKKKHFGVFCFSESHWFQIFKSRKEIQPRIIGKNNLWILSGLLLNGLELYHFSDGPISTAASPIWVEMPTATLECVRPWSYGVRRRFYHGLCLYDVSTYGGFADNWTWRDTQLWHWLNVFLR